MSKLEIIKFEKPNCSPCEVVNTLLDNAGIKHTKINYMASMDMVEEFSVRSVPTVVAVVTLEDGKKSVIYNVKGTHPEDFKKLAERISHYYQTGN